MESIMFFNMEDLPKDIVSKILSVHVTGDCVLNCKLVCKTWETLLRDRKTKEGLLYLVTPRDGRSSTTGESTAMFYHGDYDDITSNAYTKNPFKPLTKTTDDSNILIGSCNGLVCLGVLNGSIRDLVHVCNPFTGEYANLPKLNMDSYQDGGFPKTVCGFGYLQKTNEYKVVRIHYPKHPGVGSVQIYTLGNSSEWRSLGEIKHSLCIWNPGVLANESLYFMDFRQREILALDLADETFQLLLPPGDKDPSATSYLKLIGEHLCVVYEIWGARVEIWSFKETNEQISSFTMGKDNNSLSWSLEYCIPWDFGVQRSYQPFSLTKSNKILLWKDGRTLVSYAPGTATVKTILNPYVFCETYKTIPHRNTSASLKSLGVCSNMIGYNAKGIGHYSFHMPPIPRPWQYVPIPQPWQPQASHPWQYVPIPRPWHYVPTPPTWQYVPIPLPWQYVPVPQPWQQDD